MGNSIASILLACSLSPSATPARAQAAASDPAQAARVTLGEGLFGDQRFTNPAMDYSSSCSGCHARGEQVPGKAPRAFADSVPRSLSASKDTTLRNTPTLYEAARAERFGHDGEYASLEEMIADKLTGPLLGWKAADRARALEFIATTLNYEGPAHSAATYAELFQQAYHLDVARLPAAETVDAAVRALADFVRSLRSSRTAVWDAFAEQNRIKKEPSPGEPVKSYAYGLESRLGNQEGRLLIKRPETFTLAAYEGFKLFFRVFAEEGQSAGNCVSCHVPPHFTDHRFHNIGTAQLAYDAVHGEGAFARYVPGAEPSEETRSLPAAAAPRRADLGYWNFAPPAGRDAALGAFKTPTLRNLSGTDPYLHDGSAPRLRDLVAQKVRLARMAREGVLRNADPELLEMKLLEKDIEPLVAFLSLLDDKNERYRHYLIHFEPNEGASGDGR